MHNVVIIGTGPAGLSAALSAAAAGAQKGDIVMILAGADQSFFEETINAALWDGYVKADEQKNIPFILAVEGRRLNGYRLHCQSILDETPWSKELWWALKQVRTAQSTGAVVSIALRLYRRLQ